MLTSIRASLAVEVRDDKKRRIKATTTLPDSHRLPIYSRPHRARRSNLRLNSSIGTNHQKITTLPRHPGATTPQDQLKQMRRLCRRIQAPSAMDHPPPGEVIHRLTFRILLYVSIIISECPHQSKRTTLPHPALQRRSLSRALSTPRLTYLDRLQ